jgi:hypothetical protein
MGHPDSIQLVRREVQESVKKQFPRLSTLVESLGNHFFEEFQKSMHLDTYPMRHGGFDICFFWILAFPLFGLLDAPGG